MLSRTKVKCSAYAWIVKAIKTQPLHKTFDEQEHARFAADEAAHKTKIYIHPSAAPQLRTVPERYQATSLGEG